MHWAGDAEEARRQILDICRSAGAKTVTKGKSMITEEIGLNEFLAENGDQPGGDGSRRIHHPAARRASEPHHRAGRAPQQGPGRGRLPPRPHPVSTPAATSPSRCRCSPRRARCCGRTLPRGGRRHHRREFPGRRDRHLGHRHQRGQRRPDADAAARCTSSSPRSRRSCRRWRTRHRSCACWRARRPARRCPSTRPSPPARAGRRIRTGRRSTTSCSSTTAAPRCSAPSSRTCCAASAAAPA